jgi:hypothetical protein
MDDLQFYSIELPKIKVNNSREIDRILWMLSDIGDLLDDIKPCERTDEHRRLIDTAIKKLDECDKARRHKTDDQASSLGFFIANFKSFKRSFTEQAAKNEQKVTMNV